MALPAYLFADGFEDGTSGAWDVADSDTSSQLDYPHYTVLARTPGLPMPYRGAYCARIVMAAGNTNDATFGDAANGALATTNTIWWRFNIWLGQDIIDGNAADDVIPLVQFQKADGTVELVFGIKYNDTAGTITWGAGVAAPTNFSTGAAQTNTWNTVELKVNVVTGAATGEIEVYVTPDGQEPSSTVVVEKTAVQSSAATTKAIVGVQDKLSATTGTILLDNFIVDNIALTARIYPEKNRFSTVRTLSNATTQTRVRDEHVFIGPGTVTGITAIDGGADSSAVVTVYDTDTAQAYDSLRKATVGVIVAGDTKYARNVPFDVLRGCYVTVEGTTPVVAEITIDRAPNWFSDGNMRRFAHRRNLTG